MASNIGLTPAPTGSTTQGPTGSAPSGQAAGAPQQSIAPTEGAPTDSNTTTASGSNSNPSSAGDIIITERFMSDTSWPADLRLDLAKSNWEEWSFQLQLESDRLGFTKWLKGTLPQPDAILHPKAHDIWETNDCSLRAFIFGCISKADYNAVGHLPTSHRIFTELRQRHEKFGAHAQFILIKKALDYRYSPDSPLCEGAEEVLAMHTKIAKIGPVDLDQLKIIFLINAFGDKYEHLQPSIFTAMDSPSFGIKTILRRFQQEDAINRARAEQSGSHPTALAAVRRDRPPRVCSNCKKEGHLAAYCIQTGGGMAGKTLDDVRTAQRNARRGGRNGGGSSQQASAATANVATSTATLSNGAVTINGQTFLLTPAPSTSPAPSIAA